MWSYKKGNIVGEGIYGEGQLLSADDFLFVLQLTARLKLQFQSGSTLLKSLDPSLVLNHLVL